MSPELGSLRGDFAETALLVLRAFAHFLLLSAVFGAGAITAVRKSYTHAAVILVVGLATLAGAGYLAFWTWFLSPRLGYVYSVLASPLCAICVTLQYRKLSSLERTLMRSTAAPWVCAFAATFVIFGIGFLYGGIRHPLTTAQTRFSDPLPPDNTLPLVFANQTEDGNIQHPMSGEWLSSDRPPLQTGITLLVYPYRLGPRTQAYMIVAVFLQCLWLPALWALMDTFGIRREARLWPIIAVLLSGFTLLNSLFVWPKLFSAAYAIGVVALLFGERSIEKMWEGRSVAVLTGICVAFSMLAHGGNAFFFLGLAATLIVLCRRIPLRAPGLMLAGFLACYLPWIAYQKLVDPPGDHLLKMHLAGVEQADSRPLIEVIESAYATQTPQRLIQARAANLTTVFDHQRQYWRGLWTFLGCALRIRAGDPGQAAKALRVTEFFYFFPALGFYMAGPPLLALGLMPRYRTRVWQAAASCWVIVFCTLLIWCLLMFKPGAAIIHQGSYAAMVLAIAASALSFWSISRWLARMVVSLQSLLTCLSYVPRQNQLPHLPEALLLVAAAGVLTLTLRWMTVDRSKNLVCELR